jgi:deoxyribonuclease-1
MELIVKSIIPLCLILPVLISFSVSIYAQNQFISSFTKVKKVLHEKIYFDYRKSLYCNASFSELKVVTLPKGFHTNKYIKRSTKIEWEHVVPAENFGKSFTEWTDGHPNCVRRNGDLYKGRSCANKMNEEFKYIASDMYNLFPAIGSVNALRSNFNFEILDNNIERDFGSCDMRIDNKKAQPPEQARGRIARAYLYMDHTYAQFKMSSSQRNLMTLWDKQYPVSTWECLRAKRIKEIQGNSHLIYDEIC